MKKIKGMQIFLGIGLAVILFALIHLGIGAFYPEPEYEDYCGIRTYKAIETEYECNQTGGRWMEITGVEDPTRNGYCDLDYYCRQEYDSAQNDYNNSVFYVFVIIGLGLSILGFLIKKSPFDITSLATGMAVITEGIFRNYDEKMSSFVVGTIAFIILVYFVYKRFGEKR